MSETRILTSVFVVAVALLSGCMGSTGSEGSDGLKGPPPTADGKVGTDPYAPCTDPVKCCGAVDMVCWGDLDKTTVCKCNGLWDCSLNPKKCEQSTPTPPGTPAGAGGWLCTWTDAVYTCVGKPATPPPVGVGGWECKKDASGTTTCTHTPPNPSNTPPPPGGGAWKCTVQAEFNKLLCERDAPRPDGGVKAPDLKPTKETNCADGIDNDGDGLVDCKDPDCPPCPPPACPPGTECCDGKDNNGNGKIDEGNVCGSLGNGEPCPPGAYQVCDCYCGVHRKCKADGTWGPCLVDGTCKPAAIISQSQCSGPGQYCDFGKCVAGWPGGLGTQCKKHNDCTGGLVCDLGFCVKDAYTPWKCP